MSSHNIYFNRNEKNVSTFLLGKKQKKSALSGTMADKGVWDKLTFVKAPVMLMMCCFFVGWRKVWKED